MSEFHKLPDEYIPLHDEFKTVHIKADIEKKDLKDKRKRKRLLNLFFNGFAGMSILLYASSFVEPVISNTNDIVDIQKNENTTQPILIDDAKVATKILSIIESHEDDIDLTHYVLELVSCPECTGNGIICPGAPDFGYDRGNGHGYEGCHGTGFSPCPDIWCVNGIRTCQGCKGSGIDQNGVSCEICGGDGIDDCEFCHGTGIAECISLADHYTCFRCEGTGQVEEKVPIDS